MPEVFAALSRWYGYEFHFADPAIARQNLTAIVSTQSSASALSTIKLLLNVDLRFEGRVVTVMPRRTSHVPALRRSILQDSLSSPTREVGR
jgi:hypothetical protein